MMTTPIDINSRVQRAQELFKDGFNCSQAVFASCADMYGIDNEELALRLASSFGGGIGRMRMTCGAACGMFLLAGLESGSVVKGDAEGKKRNYALVQELADKFRQENGKLNCADLLGLTAAETAHLEPTPAPRNPEYFKKRPCVEIVGCAVRIYLETIQKCKKGEE